jgi:uncharacterized protein (DUF2062 family)
MTTYTEIISPDQTADGTAIWKKLLSQGLTAHQLALAVAVGLTIGVLPTLWGSSLICVLISWRLGLNHLAVQSINYLVFPLQLALFVPFAIWGRQLCPGWFTATRSLAWENLQHDWSVLGSTLLPAQCSALVGWATLMPAFLLAGYGLSFWVFRTRERRNLITAASSPDLQN